MLICCPILAPRSQTLKRALAMRFYLAVVRPRKQIRDSLDYGLAMHVQALVADYFYFSYMLGCMGLAAVGTAGSSRVPSTAGGVGRDLDGQQ